MALRGVKSDSAIVQNRSAKFNMVVPQPVNYASVSLTHKGKIFIAKFVLDSGTTNMTVEIGSGSKLKISGLANRSFKINNLVEQLMDSTFSDYIKNQKTKVLGIPMEVVKKATSRQFVVLQSYPNDYYSILELKRLSHTDKRVEFSKEIFNVWNSLSAEVKSTPLGKQVYEEQTWFINSFLTAKAGSKARIFTVNDINGNAFSNQSLLGENYLIVFSATWCLPCQEQLPGIKKIYDEYRAKGLKVVYFNDDSDKARWKAHVAKNKLTWINVSEGLKPRFSKIPKSFAVWAIPTCILVDREGNIVYNSDQEAAGISKLGQAVSNVFAVNKS